MKSINLLLKNKFSIFVYTLILIYTIIAITISLHRFWQYDAFHYDLSLFDVAIWKVSRFKAPIIDHLELGEKWNLADHFTPSIFLFSPLYWLTDKIEMILVVQSLCVGFGLVFAFLIVRKMVKNKWLQLALLMAFMGYIGLQNAIIANFHPVVAAILPLMICFWASTNKNWKLWWISLVIFLCFQEDNAIIGVGLGIYLILKQERNLRVGISTAIFSLLYGIAVTKLIVPAFSGGTYFYQPNFHRPFLDWIIGIVYPWIRSKIVLVSLATFGFLPLAGFSLLPTILATFYGRFVLAGGRDTLGLHYNALIGPLMFMAACEAYAYLNKKLSQKLWTAYAVAIILVVIIFHRFIYHGPFGLFTNPAFYQNTARQKFLNEFVAKIPTDGRIMTQNHLTPRFTHNDVVLLREDYWLYQPKYIAIELRGGQNPNNFWPVQEWIVKRLVNTLKQDKNYLLIYSANEQYLFKKAN